MISVVKIGGNVIDSPELLEKFCDDFAALEGPKVLVHGGGKIASDFQRRLGTEPQMIEGRRITDPDTLQLVTMVYAGWCSKHITALLQARGCNAMGLAGCDASIIRAGRRAPKLLSDGVTLVDYGLVGDVSPESVDASKIRQLLDMGVVPVFSAITHDGRGELLNTNADTIAASISSAINAKLLYCFEKNGVLYSLDDSSSVIPRLDFGLYTSLKREGRIAAGMIPKLDNAFAALRAGAAGVTVKHSAQLLEPGAGTTLVI